MMPVPFRFRDITPRRRVVGFWAAAMLTLVFGCGRKGPETIAVDGTVTWKGKPIAGAVVGFSPAGKGTPATGVTDSAGHYRLTTFKHGDGAIAGEYRVGVSAFEGGGGGPYGEAEKPRKWIIPEKFSNPTKSGLKASVSSSTREFNFNLTE